MNTAVNFLSGAATTSKLQPRSVNTSHVTAAAGAKASAALAVAGTTRMAKKGSPRTNTAGHTEVKSKGPVGGRTAQDRSAMATTRETALSANAKYHKMPSTITLGAPRPGNSSKVASSIAGMRRVSASGVSTSTALSTASAGLCSRPALCTTASCGSVRDVGESGPISYPERRPFAPRPTHFFSQASIPGAAPEEAVALWRSATAASFTSTASVPGSHGCSRTPSTTDLSLPLSSSRMRPPFRGPFASAPASRIGSVNSRLAERRMPLICGSPSQPPRTGVVRRITTKGADVVVVAPTTTAPETSALAFERALVPEHADPAVNSTPALVSKPAATRPFLRTNGVPARETRGPTRAPRPQPQFVSTPASSRTEKGTRSVCGGGGGWTSARAAARNSLANSRPSQPVLSAQTTPGSTSQKATRRPRVAASAALVARPPAPFHQRSSATPAPFSSVGSMKASAVPKGPVSPIKRTSTACPGAARTFPVPFDEETGQNAHEELHAYPADSLFGNPWLRSGVLSTPINGDGVRDQSEAPTIPYEGSTGLRGSASVSPRTECDGSSVGGRLSYGF